MRTYILWLLAEWDKVTPPSPFIWDAFFDILLVALKIGAQAKFWLRASGDRLVEIRDTAYADDLLSPTSELQLLQRKANIVSAFVMIFGPRNFHHQTKISLHGVGK